MKIKIIFFLVVIVSGCSIANRKPSGHYTSVPYTVNLDFDLYKSDLGSERYYQDSKEEELDSFLIGGERVMKAQQKIAGKSKDYAGPKRVFHTKQLGCFPGKLILNPNRPESVRKGMFANDKSEYNVLVRFSNGVGMQRDDKLPDVRGAAIKVFDVANSKTGQPQSVDFLMTNSPTPFGKDFLEFVDFMDAVAEAGPNLGLAAFLAKGHVKASQAIVRASGGVLNYKTKSVATLRYWSGHPYLLGPSMAMKFNIRSKEKGGEMTKAQIKDLGPELSKDFLRWDFENRLNKHPVKFIFGIQLQKNAKDTPIEDNLTEWTEKASPTIDVAELVLEQGNSALWQACEGMRFTPGHYVPEHRPLSNMGRGRLFAYEASQIGRQANDKMQFKSQPPLEGEPTLEDFLRLKNARN
jgi:catalase